MKNHKKFVYVLIAVIAVCAAAVGAAAMNMDRILMRVSPEMYISYIAVNTINELENEKDMIDEAMPELHRLADSHFLSVRLETEHHKLELAEDFDEDKPSVVFSGTYNGAAFDGYINNSETGICLPSLLDVYFTFSTKSFGDDFAEGGGDKLFPGIIPRETDLTLPSDDKGELIKSSELMSIGKRLISGAKIHHDEGNEYYLILKSENVKTAVRELADILKKNGGAFSERLEGIASISLNDISDILTAWIDNAELGETAAVKYTVCKNYVSKLETEIKSGDTTAKLVWDASGGARLLEDMTVSVISESGSSRVGFEYRESGNRFFENEEKQDKRELRVIFGGEDILKLMLDLNFDKAGKQLTGSAAANGISAELSGTVNDENLSVEVKNIRNNGEYIGNASLWIADVSHMQIHDREKYPFKDLQSADAALIKELLRQGE